MRHGSVVGFVHCRQLTDSTGFRFYTNLTVASACEWIDCIESVCAHCMRARGSRGQCDHMFKTSPAHLARHSPIGPRTESSDPAPCPPLSCRVRHGRLAASSNPPRVPFPWLEFWSCPGWSCPGWSCVVGVSWPWALEATSGVGFAPAAGERSAPTLSRASETRVPCGRGDGALALISGARATGVGGSHMLGGQRAALIPHSPLSVRRR